MARLAESSYGKCDVRLTKVVRESPRGAGAEGLGERHSLLEFTVRIMLGGAFERVYTEGDNSSCIPTDTMKNTVYALAKTHQFESAEEFGEILAAHFAEFQQVGWAEVSIEQEQWKRITLDGAPHPHSFTRSGSGVRTARVRAQRGGPTAIWGGVKGLDVIKTTRSGFAGFFKDKFTTLPETTDRIFATAIDASWEYAPPRKGSLSYAEVSETARDTLLETFAQHDSLSVQQTIYAMGEALLARCPQVKSVSLSMPNQHRLLVSLKPFGMDNPNEIFVATSEPYGLINGTVTRE